MRKVLMHGSETWAMKREDKQRMMRTERSMVRRMCGVSLNDGQRSGELLRRLGMVGGEVIRDKSALRWLGQVERMGELD